MSVNITSYSNSYSTSDTLSTKSTNKPSSKSTTSENTASNSSSYTISDSYESTKKTVSSKEIKESLVKQAEQQAKNFEKLLTSVFNKQANKSNISSSYLGTSIKTLAGLKDVFEDLEVDSETVKKAQEAISEDGYYGVKQTSERILNLAKAIVGNDPSKIDMVRGIVEKSFSNVEKMWGGQLPDICQQTYERVMENFDQWEVELA